jgi:D-alanyl-D-alanine carboxypeptidase
VARVTHKDIGTAVTELVIRPAHLPDTYWPPAGERHIRGPHARNYTVAKADPAGPLVDVTEIEPSWAGASGAMVSTPSDLNRFWQRLLGGRLLPRWALAEMQTTVPAPGLGPDMSYGLGLIRVTLPCGGQLWAHGGDLLGGGVANISGRADSGRAVTVYINALTGNPPATHLLRTTAIALCS